MDCPDAKKARNSDENTEDNIQKDAQNESTNFTSRSSIANLMFAVNFAAKKHKNQRRKDPEGTPYINHPIGVAQILVEEGGVEDLEIIQAAILHDTVEDTDTTPEELKTVFGDKVAGIVAELTDNKSLPQIKRKEAQIAHAPNMSQEAKVVGMCDKIYNLRDLQRCLPSGWDDNRRSEYFIWAKKVCVSYYEANSKLAAILQKIFVEQGVED